MQVFKRFVEIGRVALINEGPDQGKLCVILDVIDQRRVRDGIGNMNFIHIIQIVEMFPALVETYSNNCWLNWRSLLFALVCFFFCFF